jgi:hypothetical protein
MMLILLVVAATLWLYVRTVKQSLGPAPIGIKILIPLDILVLDNATGQPIPGAKVDLPLLHPDRRNRPELEAHDLGRGLSPMEEPAPFLTDENGRAKAAVMAMREKRLEHRVHGLLPVAGSPEIVFHPVAGVRVRASGHETWVKTLEEIRREDGRLLAHGTALPVVIRLKRAASPGP